MLSIIICSRTKEINDNLLRNIKEHIGNIIYEIICIDNSKNQYNIFQAYNNGIKKASYPYLCFMHDDILFHSDNWGRNIIKHFEDESIGMLGISGPRFLSFVPSIWWGSNAYNKYSPSVCQHSLDTNRNTRVSVYQNIKPTYKNTIDVIAIDGLFFCIRKSLFDHISFDEKTYKGFHFYDLDISMQIKNSGYRIVVIYDVLIEHISASQLNISWLDSARFFYDKWKNNLPLTTYKMTLKERKNLERSSLKVMSEILSDNHVSMISYLKLREILYLSIWYPKSIAKMIGNIFH